MNVCGCAGGREGRGKGGGALLCIIPYRSHNSVTRSLTPLLLYTFTHTHTDTLILTPLQRAKQLNSSQVTKFGFLINLRWNPILLAHPQQVLLPREPAKPNQKRECVCTVWFLLCVCVCWCLGVWVCGCVCEKEGHGQRAQAAKCPRQKEKGRASVHTAKGKEGQDEGGRAGVM